MPGQSQKFSIRIFGVLVWTVLTFALVAWWFVIALRFAGEAKHRMLISEATFLFAMLLLGALVLLYYISRETKRAQQIQIFFSSFTHDLKTSLASLRLQAEALEEDIQDDSQSKLLRRLVKDTVRLQLQLENSLYVANPDSAALHPENIKLKEFFSSLSLQWPDLKINVQVNSVVKADPRALESVFKNLIQNSVVHGHASEVIVSDEQKGNDVSIRVSDNGRGFVGNPKQVAQPFHQHHGSSGSGVGLYLVKMLVRKMNGQVNFQFEPKFKTEVILPKGVVA